jgi:hypothetical protein
MRVHADRWRRAAVSLAALCAFAAVVDAAERTPRKPGWSNDQPPIQRDLMVMEALLPGTYDNHEQVYFDDRLDFGPGQKHRRVHTEIRRIGDERFGQRAFLVQSWWDDDASRQDTRIYSLYQDDAENAIRVEIYFFTGLDLAPYRGAFDDLKRIEGVQRSMLTHLPGCNLFFRRVVGGFHGAMKPKACRYDREGQKVYADFQITVGERTYWTGDIIRRLKDDVQVNEEPLAPHRQNRARWFTCSLSEGDGPGARRYGPFSVMDQGGLQWVNVPSGAQPQREVGLHLRNVDWAMNNTRTGFTNDVFSFYLEERWPGQPRRHIMYAFQAPDAERAGINLVNEPMLAYCVLKEATRSRPRL